MMSVLSVGRKTVREKIGYLMSYANDVMMSVIPIFVASASSDKLNSAVMIFYTVTAYDVGN